MNISYFTDLNDIKKIRTVGKLSAEVLEFIQCYVKPGISTGKLNNICNNYIINKQHALSASLGYQGFPKSVCISVNDVVCHGIPSNKKKLKFGDILNIDVAIVKDGFYGDTSKMFYVGTPNILAKRLCDITQKSLYLAICIIKPGVRLRELGKVIQKFVEAEKFSIVREYCGHGIGRSFHEDPQVLHYDTDDNGIVLKSGMVFTIEPMVNAGKCHVHVMKDGWTVKTKDHSLSAQYEHTVLVTECGCEIITLRSDEKYNEIFNHRILL
ncbi:MAG: methionine aminopeptidase [Candidatus Westeberhardia cardiocondylae]|nr:methionine aminopeptidase [Candidatus Westeberhardia cardiocondylae]